MTAEERIKELEDALRDVIRAYDARLNITRCSGGTPSNTKIALRDTCDRTVDEARELLP